ncbi:hypothetical protein Tco_0742414 [Tanacetum coccineum]
MDSNRYSNALHLEAIFVNIKILIMTFLYKQETASKSRQERDGKQESSSKSRQARVDKKETGGKQETAIHEKAENTEKECMNWKHKKKDKEQEALLISEDTAFVITGENIRPKPNPMDLEKIKRTIRKNEVLQPTRMPNTKSSIRRISKEVVNENGPVKIENRAERDSAKTKAVVENQEEDAVKNK